MANPRSTALFLLASLFLGAAAPAPAPEAKSFDAQLQAVRAAKPAERSALAQDLVKEYVRLSETLLGDRKYPAAIDALRKARGVVTGYVTGPAGQQLGGELDVRINLAQWREKNDGRGLRAEFFDGKEFGEKVAERIKATAQYAP